MPKSYVTRSVRIEPEDYALLTTLAFNKGVSVEAAIREAIVAWMSAQTDQREVEREQATAL